MAARCRSWITPAHIVTRLVAGMVLSATFGTALADAQIKAQVPAEATPPWNKGIQAISSESYYHAIECGKQGGENPPCVFYDTGLCKNDDFTLSLYTPYKFVAYSVWQAVRKNQPAPKPSYSAAQRTRVVLGIAPVRGSKNTITGVTLKRGAQVVKPATQTIDGATATFIFDYAAFAPTGNVTIDLAGKIRHQTCLIERSVLARLR